jgi:hypothetical protein
MANSNKSRGLVLARLNFTGALILTFSYGLFHVLLMIYEDLHETVGLYFCMAGMTVYFLSHKPKRAAGLRVALAYTIFMMVIGTTALLTTLVTLEAAIVESPARTPSAFNNYYCAPVYVASSLLSTFQFLASDALLVSTTSHKASSLELKESVRCTVHIHSLRGVGWQSLGHHCSILHCSVRACVYPY